MSSVTTIEPNQLIPNFQQYMAQAAAAAAHAAAHAATTSTETPAPIDQEFVTVTRRKFRANVMIETAAFGDKTTSAKDRLNMLRQKLVGVAIPLSTPRVKHVRNPIEAPPKPFYVFEVGHEAQLAALVQAGHSNSDKKLFAFIHMDESIHVAEESRTIELTSIHPRTTTDDIKVALAHLGSVEHVALHPSNKSGISRAVVTFETSTPVEALISQQTTGLAIGSDTCLIRRLGSTQVDFDRDLTLKLAKLPRGLSPFDLSLTLKDQGLCYGLHIPFNPATGQRRPEAF
ncbi:hypothetical protein BGZ83_004080, partial [Gryganskiella cystojenkinii]